MVNKSLTDNNHHKSVYYPVTGRILPKKEA